MKFSKRRLVEEGSSPESATSVNNGLVPGNPLMPALWLQKKDKNKVKTLIASVPSLVGIF